MPQPPSPTTTNFLLYAGGSVTVVSCETADSAAVDMVKVDETVPLLARSLVRRTGFLLTAVTETEEPLRRR